ncbi:23S rRNA (uracil(1939)-C(5))-methyltransferase RlmD [Albibacterium profundi]|uniref:23S rRNA (Uracil(1939)-C(5))-methyltransferase RlmD n=1 Tax=Albibacterium profundi TaxID=3134906 RepID=A0ABV5CDK7_9SPHI
MRKNKRERIKIDQLEVIDIAEEGKGVAKADDLVLFIPRAVPGDVVDVEVTRKKRNFAEANITTLRRASEHRVEPFCAHFGICGGCKWQHMSYAAQLLYKNKSVENALSRIGKVDTSIMEDILPSQQATYYRNKLEYTFSNQRWLTQEEIDSAETLERNALGFHVPQRFDKILAVEHCYLQAEPSNDIRNSISDFAIENGISFYDLRKHEGSLRNLIIRNTSTGELMVIIVFAYPEEGQIEQLMSFILEKFPTVNSLLYVVNQKKNDTIFDQVVHVFHGRDHIFEAMGDLTFKIGAKSFYQTNSLQAHELYKITKEFAGLTGQELLYDLYTGAGTIANFVAGDARKVIGVEYVPTAIEDAKVNSDINGIENTDFYAGDMKDVLNDEFINTHGKPDVIITDPPRAGMHADVVKKLLEIEAEKIVYVSCNAATQARDLLMLAEKYDMRKSKAVDMFPQTQHVENVVLLTLKK